MPIIGIIASAITGRLGLTVDYLVVAGGAGGAYNRGAGGGGAGGLRSTVTATGGGGSLETPLSLSLNTSYTVVVGAGGAALTTDSLGLPHLQDKVMQVEIHQVGQQLQVKKQAQVVVVLVRLEAMRQPLKQVQMAETVLRFQ